MNHPITPRPLLNLACLLLAAWTLATPAPARAETASTCSGFIDSVPAVISTQGVWCLRRDVSTAQASGAAIVIDANNVTIDCNGFKIGGLGAGDNSRTTGIHAHNRKNAVIRNCNIRGFRSGIDLSGGVGTQDHSSGHLVEDNRVDQSLKTGIYVHPGKGHVIRRNLVFDTGGATDSVYVMGIYASADVIDNTVSGLFPVVADGSARGISVLGGGNVVRGNTIHDLGANGAATPTGILALGRGNLMSDNVVQLIPAGAGSGIYTNEAYNYCGRNVVGGFASPIVMCNDAGGNHAY